MAFAQANGAEPDGLKFKGCGIRIAARESIWNFDSGSSRALVIDVSRIRKNRSCHYFIGVSPGVAGVYDRILFGRGGSTIKYGVFTSPCTPSTPNCTNPQMKDGRAATQRSEVVAGFFEKDKGPDTQTHMIYPVFPLEPVNSLSTTNRIKAWGLYGDAVMLNAYESAWPLPSGAPAVPDASTAVLFTKHLPKFATVSIVDKGAPYVDPPVTTRVVNFGTFRGGAIQEFDLISLFNAGYDLKIASQNGSRLRPRSGPSFIRYGLSVGGIPVHLPAGTAVRIGSSSGVSPPPGNGVRTPVKVTIDGASLATALGGTYSDTLTVTITSTE